MKLPSSFPTWLLVPMCTNYMNISFVLSFMFHPVAEFCSNYPKEQLKALFFFSFRLYRLLISRLYKL